MTRSRHSGLFPLPPAEEASLTPRQREALAILRDRYPEGLGARALGACFEDQWAHRVGLQLAQALKLSGLVRQGAGGIYFAIVESKGPGELPADF